jgi:uncharacterized protein YjdB
MPLRSLPGSRELGVFLLLVSIAIGVSCGKGGDVTGPPDDPPNDPPGPTAVASVELTPTTLNLSVGQRSQLTATARAADGGTLPGRTISWATGDADIATVDPNGMVTAVATGDVAVTATSEGKIATAAVTVSNLAVATVAVLPSPSSVAVGKTARLTAVPKAADGTELIGRPVSWATSDPAVVTVDGTGLITGVAVGDATIAATSEGKSGSSQLTVSAVAVASVEVEPATGTVAEGTSAQLTATAKDVSGAVLAGRPAAWTTDKPGVARVNAAGRVTAIGAGSATITAAIEGKTGTATISVTARPAASVEVRPGTASLIVGQSVQFTATVKAADGTVLPGRIVSWVVDPEAVARVSGTGLVSGLVAGTATLTAMNDGVKGTASLTVTAPTGRLRTWKGGVSGKASDWSAAANWTPTGKPIAVDTVRIPVVSQPAVLSEAVQVAGLIVAGGRLRNGGHTLRVKAP